MSNQYDITKDGEKYHIIEYTVDVDNYKERLNYYPDRSMGDIDAAIADCDVRKAYWQNIKTLCEGLE